MPASDAEPGGAGAWRAPARAVGRLVELGGTTVGGVAKLGRDSLLAALLAALDGLGVGSAELGAAGAQEDQGPAITRRLLSGDGLLTREQVAGEAGVDLELATRLWRAVGFPEVGDGVPAFTTTDVGALRDVCELVGAGAVDEDGAVAMARPMGQLLSRLAASHTALVADVLGAHLGAAVAAGEDLGDVRLSERVTEQAVAVTADLLPALERTTLHVWRRHLAAAAGRELVPTADPTTPAAHLAVGFVDISGYTQLTRTLAQPQLAALLDQFETVVWNAVVAGGGRVVKSLGDELLFVADSADAAARIALAALDAAQTGDPELRVHAGLAWGSVLRRGGDVYGPVVNVASRLTGLADRDTVRVDQACADELVGHSDLVLTPQAPRAVRGYDHLRSFELRHR